MPRVRAEDILAVGGGGDACLLGGVGKPLIFSFFDCFTAARFLPAVTLASGYASVANYMAEDIFLVW
jgi:hypothetical protein